MVAELTGAMEEASRPQRLLSKPKHLSPRWPGRPLSSSHAEQRTGRPSLLPLSPERRVCSDSLLFPLP